MEKDLRVLAISESFLRKLIYTNEFADSHNVKVMLTACSILSCGASVSTELLVHIRDLLIPGETGKESVVA